jgi:hypothetical protein
MPAVCLCFHTCPLDVFFFFAVLQFAELRQTYAASLAGQLAKLKLSSKIPKSALYAITQLQRHLVHESTHRQLERMLFNAHMLRTEKQHCDEFVEQQLTQQRVAALTEQVRLKTATERKVEGQVYSLYVVVISSGFCSAWLLVASFSHALYHELLICACVLRA